MLGLVPIVILLLLAVPPRSPKADILYQIAALLVVAGFLSIIVLHGRVDASHATLVNGLLFAGSECFEVLMWFALASIGARNKVNALAVLAWGRAASSFGLLCGATFGHWADALTDSLVLSALVAAVLFLFVAVNLTVLKGFSFQGTIEGVQAVTQLRVRNPLDMESGYECDGGAGVPFLTEGNCDGFESAANDVAASGERESAPSSPPSDPLAHPCAEVAQEFHLTPRESEILAMLAHGRNVPYIQEKLVLSRNTVKTHVQNIYAKLHVHSQQELIDLVEDFG